jgi:hypothetical protein
MSIRAELSSVRAKACTSAGFLTAEASLQSDSTTMQAKRPQAARMLKFRVVGSTGAERFGKDNIASLAGLSLNVMTVWLLARLGIYFLVANLFGIGAGVASNYALSAAWVWGRL